MDTKFNNSIVVNFEKNWDWKENQKIEFIEHTVVLFTSEKYENKTILLNIKPFEKSFLVAWLVKVNGLELVLDFIVPKNDIKKTLDVWVGEVGEALKKWYDEHAISPKSFQQELRDKPLVQGQEFVLKNATGDYYQISIGKKIKMIKEFIDISLLSDHLVSLIKDALYEAFISHLEKENLNS